MGNVFWKPNAGDSDWGTGANWDTGSVPVSNDKAYIYDGAIAIDGDDQKAVDLDVLAIGPDYQGDHIGSSAAYLYIGADMATIYPGIGMAGDIYIGSGVTAGGAALIDDCRVKMSGDNELYLKGTVTRLVIRRGHVHLVEGTFTTVYVEWDGVGTAPTLTIEGGTVTDLWYTGTCTIDQTGGTVTTRHAMTGGTDTIGDAATATNIYVLGTSTITDNSRATTTLVEAFAGTVQRAANTPKTYTSIRSHGYAVINLDVGADVITYTNAPQALGATAIRRYTA